MADLNEQPQTPGDEPLSIQRRADDRRAGNDRRKLSREESGYTGPERRAAIDRRTGLERRRGAGIRRSDDRRAAEEGEMNTDQNWPTTPPARSRGRSVCTLGSPWRRSTAARS